MTTAELLAAHAVGLSLCTLADGAFTGRAVDALLPTATSVGVLGTVPSSAPRAC